MMLSSRRANIVKGYLEKNGIAPNRMSTKGLGATQPIASNTTKEGRSQNRRVDFIVIRKESN
jgi:outer membrane protein OmpA-like peptidoglycan-associated protein